MWPKLLTFAVVCQVGSCGVEPAMQTIFRDDFDSTALEAEWTVLRQDDATLSLSERPGFLRIYTQPGTVGTSDTAHNLVLRGIIGDFTISTQLEFDPAVERQLAGLLVRGDDGRSVVFGLSLASGERGTFRGVAAVAERGSGEEADRSGALYAFNDVILRLQRAGDRFTVSFSRTGDAFTTAGTVTTNLSQGVSVGVAAATGEECVDNCDLATPADFDWFEIAVPAP